MRACFLRFRSFTDLRACQLQNVTGFSVTGGSSPVMIKNSIKQNSSLGVLLDNAGSESQYLQNTITGNSVRLQSDSGCPDGLEP